MFLLYRLAVSPLVPSGIQAVGLLFLAPSRALNEASQRMLQTPPSLGPGRQYGPLKRDQQFQTLNELQQAALHDVAGDIIFCWKAPERGACCKAK